MERYYADGGKKIRDEEIRTAADLAKYATAFVPGDAEFEASFATASVSQAFLARYYLQALEQSLRGEKNPELVPNTLEKEVNLEHILPQNPQLRDWPGFDEESAAANVKRIGNLTLLKADDNNSGGNRPFAAKKSAYSRSQLKLNSEISSAKEWTAASISARQVLLAKEAKETWPLKP